MSKFCRGADGRGVKTSPLRIYHSRSRGIGLALIAVGALVLLLFVPYWVWTSVLAILLISIGFLVWRFG